MSIINVNGNIRKKELIFAMKFYKKLGREEKKRIYRKLLKENKNDLIISFFFIILSTSTPVLSIKNTAIWVLLWYLLSFGYTMHRYVSQEAYNKKIKRENHYNKRHKTNKKRKKQWKNDTMEWDFLGIKLLNALLFGVIMLIISQIHQWQNYYSYMKNEKDFFSGIWNDIGMVTICTLYYNIIVDAIRNNKDSKCIKKNILSLFGTNIWESMITYIFLAFLCVKTLYCSFNEFSIFGNPLNYIWGGIYILVLVKPFKNK